LPLMMQSGDGEAAEDAGANSLACAATGTDNAPKITVRLLRLPRLGRRPSMRPITG
jgi:hypothetical protein